MNHWMHIYQPDIHKCVAEWNRLVQRKLTDTTSLPPVSLKNMTGAFAVLLFGCGASFIIFLGEIMSRYCARRWSKANDSRKPAW